MRLLDPCLALLVLAGCPRSDTPSDAGREAPPAPEPAAAVQEAEEADEVATRSAPSPASAQLDVLAEGGPLQGEAEGLGPAEVSEGRLALADGAVDLRYTLPDGLTAPAAPSGEVKIVARNRQGPGGINRHVVAEADGALLLATTWMNAPAPIRVVLPGGITVQQRAPAGGGEGYLVAPVVASRQGAEDQAVALGGEVTTVEGIDLVVLASQFLASDDTTQGGKTYTLHLWAAPHPE